MINFKRKAQKNAKNRIKIAQNESKRPFWVQKCRFIGKISCFLGLGVIFCHGMVFAADEAESPVFELGEVLVVGGASEVSGGTQSRVTGEEAVQRGRRDVVAAAALLPEVSVTEIGGRGEKSIWVRGFDMRQVPLFIDGIPVYVPYDGNIDASRFSTFGMSELSVSPGFSPLIYGPNTLGGAINVVSLRPVRPQELEAKAGVFSGKGVEAAVRAGARRPDGYAQASVAYREREDFRVSDDFQPTETEDGGRRNNSDSRDLQVAAKAAWTPGDRGDELVAGFVRQDSAKGVPPYTGSDPAVRPRYWRYTDWVKNSLYAVGRKSFGPDGYVKPRVFYDTYENTLKSFDDATYTTQAKKYAFTSMYDDYTFGGSLEAGKTVTDRHILRGAVHYKQDVHRERNAGEPESEFSDWTGAVALEDRVRLAKDWALALGADVERRESLKAADRSGPETVSYPDNGNTTVNPQAGLFYAVTGGVFRVTLAQKSRFPTLKDRYSYKLGTALPNPDLDPETARHAEAGYEGRVISNVECRASVFYSRLDDTITQVDQVEYDQPTDTWLAQMQNVGESEHYGTELGLVWQARPDLKLGGQYAFLKRRNLDRPDIQPTDTPEHRASLYAEWQAWSRLMLVPGVEYSSSRYSTSYGTKADGFWLCNLDLQVMLPHGFSLNAGIHNLLDENYELNEGYPEEGRNYYVSLRMEY